MSLAVEPDTYSPSIDEQGRYIDKIPPFNNIQNGLRCPCGTRKDKVYKTYSIFFQHIKTETHKKWLAYVNVNRANYYIENEEMKQLIQNQKLIISKLEKDLNNRNLTIDYLTQQLHNSNNNHTISNQTIGDLIDFD
jgi:hypothetical protein